MDSIPPFSFPLRLKNNKDISNIYHLPTLKVAVNYYIYDSKQKCIVRHGSSRACGANHNKPSLHAEQCAIHYCMNHDKRNKYIIYISRFSKEGNHKPKVSCNACCKIAKKYRFENRIFTINEDLSIISAIVENPNQSLAYRIK